MTARLPYQALIAQMMVGKEAEEFLKSDVGKVLIGRARQEAIFALRELKTVWPWRKRRIQVLQNRVAWAEAFEGWIRELAANGKMAEETFDQLQAEAEDAAEVGGYDGITEEAERPN